MKSRCRCERDFQDKLIARRCRLLSARARSPEAGPRCSTRAHTSGIQQRGAGCLASYSGSRSGVGDNSASFAHGGDHAPCFLEIFFHRDQVRKRKLGYAGWWRTRHLDAGEADGRRRRQQIMDSGRMVSRTGRIRNLSPCRLNVRQWSPVRSELPPASSSTAINRVRSKEASQESSS